MTSERSRHRKGQDRKTRYSAKLLFQYLVGGKRQNLFEERIVCFSASGEQQALRCAKQAGKNAMFSGENEEGQRVRFDFVGIRDLRHLGVECDDSEVWYDVFEMALPVPRKSRLVKSDAALLGHKTKAGRAAAAYAPLRDSFVQPEPPRPYSLVRFRFDQLPVEYHDRYPFAKDAVYVFLGEIANMPGHCVVADHKSGRIYSGFHTENFAELAEDEP